jgi:hypothetical protein
MPLGPPPPLAPPRLAKPSAPPTPRMPPRNGRDGPDLSKLPASIRESLAKLAGEQPAPEGAPQSEAPQPSDTAPKR